MHKIRPLDLLLTALAPIIWGSTYLVTTELLPPDQPVTVAMLRALPAGLLLLAIVHTLPSGVWWHRSFLLGFLNFTVFWICLFVTAYRLPGGVAATVGAVQPLIVILLSSPLLGVRLSTQALLAALLGMFGVGAVILTPSAALDGVGIAAGLIGAGSMALGTVLTRRWQPPVGPLTVTAWQLSAGGLLLMPLAFLLEPTPFRMDADALLGMAYLTLIGAAVTYLLWFRGIRHLGPNLVAPLGFLSPVAAILLGWAVLGQQLTTLQIIGIATILVSILWGQRAWRSK